jgi:hypothetical protein
MPWIALERHGTLGRLCHEAIDAWLRTNWDALVWLPILGTASPGEKRFI